MTVLLDTHALIWAAREPQRLSKRAHGALIDPGNEMLVSAASAMELAIKHRKGKLPGVEVLLEQYDFAISEMRGTDLPMTARHARRAGGLDWDHRDPFDRILAAQALLEDATLITKDKAFAGVPGLRTLW